MEDLTTEFLNGFCQAILANEVVNGYGENISINVYERDNRFYASIIGFIGCESYKPGDYRTQPEGGDPFFAEIERIDLSPTWIGCKKDVVKFFEKMQEYISEICESNYKKLYA